MKISICPAPPRVQCPVGGLGPVKVEGLIFADVLCIPTATRRLLALVGAHITTWARGNGMAVGINKCGIMVVGKSM